MNAFFYILSLVLVFYFLLPKKEKPLIEFGHLDNRIFIKLQKNEYRAEEFLFDNSIDSFKYYKKVVNLFAEKPNLIRTKYDLYDWSFTYFQFDAHTFRVLRYGNKLQCVQSVKPVQIEDFEMDASEIMQSINNNQRHS